MADNSSVIQEYGKHNENKIELKEYIVTKNWPEARLSIGSLR